MRLRSLPRHLALPDARDAEVPLRVAVTGPRGEPLAVYLRAAGGSGCVKDVGALPGAVELDELPGTLAVEGGELPEEFSVELRSGSPCRRHGWDCPHWVERVLYRRAAAAGTGKVRVTDLPAG